MTLILGDCIERMAELPAESVDACVTDPPYGIGFMGKEWDTFKPGAVKQPERYEAPIESDNPNIHGRRRSPAISESQIAYDYTASGLRKFQTWTEGWAREVFRVLKPGGYILVCGAPRAYHRMACGIEDAGFEIRDCLAWIFGSGFPKSLNLGDGLGTALKPAHEPILLARKPFKGTVKANVARHGTGALNIDACRIEGALEGDPHRFAKCDGGSFIARFNTPAVVRAEGRWPANVVIDDLAALALDEQSGELVSGANPARRGSDKFRGVYGDFAGQEETPARGVDIGGASRFFYCAKPSRAERDLGCWDLPAKSGNEVTGRKPDSPGAKHSARAGVTQSLRSNTHPTVKPVELMRWLVRLVTPPGGTVIDPFLGSGTTGMAARYEQRQFIGIEREAEYLAIAERRIAACVPLFAESAPVEDPKLETADLFLGER